MNDEELLQLLWNTESDRVERKESMASPDRICEAICAFANDLPGHKLPGVLFIGVTDDGSCASLPITDRLLQQLADMRSNGNIVPFPVITVEKRVLGGCEMAIVIVQPADDPPLRFKGRTWIRVGPRRAVATPAEERRLTEKRSAGDVPFDIQPWPTAALEDLDLNVFLREYLPDAVAPEVLQENQRSLEQQLASLRFTTIDAVPTTLGILVCGRDPRHFLAGNYIQFVRVDAPQITGRIRNQRQIAGPLPAMMRMLDAHIEANISIESDISAPIEVRHADYPLVALQQLARNAVMHRSYDGTNAPVRIYWYSDRIEIFNPGGPFGQVNCDNFGEPGIVDYRNPHLAEAMRALGYVQHFGAGIPMARQALALNGNPALILEPGEAGVKVTIRRGAASL